MSVWLYRDGGKDIINGVHCDAELFPGELVGGALESGVWRLTPEAEEAEEVEKAETLQELLDRSENKDIREMAEEEGIEDFGTARIETLKEKLIAKAEDE